MGWIKAGSSTCAASASRPAARLPSARSVSSACKAFTPPSTRPVIASLLLAVTSSLVVTRLKPASSTKGSKAFWNLGLHGGKIGDRGLASARSVAGAAATAPSSALSSVAMLPSISIRLANLASAMPVIFIPSVTAEISFSL